MAWSLSVRVDSARADARLRDLSDTLGDEAGFYRKAADALLKGSREHWAAARWRPLSRATIRRKARTGESTRPMHVTGLLERALTLWHGPGQRLDISSGHLDFGLKRGGPAFYGLFHQLGKGVPQRSIRPDQQRTTRDVLSVLESHLTIRG